MEIHQHMHLVFRFDQFHAEQRFAAENVKRTDKARTDIRLRFRFRHVHDRDPDRHVVIRPLKEIPVLIYHKAIAQHSRRTDDFFPRIGKLLRIFLSAQFRMKRQIVLCAVGI